MVVVTWVVVVASEVVVVVASVVVVVASVVLVAAASVTADVAISSVLDETGSVVVVVASAVVVVVVVVDCSTKSCRASTTNAFERRASGLAGACWQVTAFPSASTNTATQVQGSTVHLASVLP